MPPDLKFCGIGRLVCVHEPDSGTVPQLLAQHPDLRELVPQKFFEFFEVELVDVERVVETRLGGVGALVRGRNDQQALRCQHPSDLRNEIGLILQMLQHLKAHREIESAWEWQFRGGSHQEVQVCVAVLATGVRDGGCVEVHADDGGSGSRQECRTVAFAAADVQDAFTLGEARRVHVPMEMFHGQRRIFMPGEESFAGPFEHRSGRQVIDSADDEEFFASRSGSR